MNKGLMRYLFTTKVNSPQSLGENGKIKLSLKKFMKNGRKKNL